MKRLMMALMVAVLLCPAVPPGGAQGDEDPANRAVEYLLSVQNENGGFGNGFSPESDLGMTADVVTAAALIGRDPETLLTGETTALDFLAERVQSGEVEAAGAGIQAKVLMAIVGAGEDGEVFGGSDLIANLLAVQAEDGVFGNGMYDHCLAVIALQAAGAELPDGAMESLLAAQNEDGGWSFMPGEASDTNTTGLCLQGLVSAGAVDEVTSAFDYLQAIQNEDGGWPYQNPSEWGTDSDVNSTALVIGALVAHGYDLAEWNDPQTWLLTLQNESGAFGFQVAVPDDNVVATVAAIPAVAGVSLASGVEAAKE